MKINSRIIPMILPTPTTPPTIAPVFDRFELEATGALVVF